MKLVKKKASKYDAAYTKTKTILQACMLIFLLGMFGIFPLYYQDKYFNMGEAKYLFVRNFSIGILGITCCVLLIRFIIGIMDKKYTREEVRGFFDKISLTDWFVIAYTIVVWISFFVSDYKADAIWGYEGWYMGLFSQMLFVLIYFLVSRYYKWKNFVIAVMLSVSAIVFLLAILHRFQIDPLGFYVGVSEKNFILFLSTIGQATWYSSYVCILFPIGLFFYWYSEKKYMRILLAGYTFIGFATVVTQNSDSAFIATGFMLLVLFCFSFQDNTRFLRWLEIVAIGLFAFKTIGMLQLIFAEKAIDLEPLSLFCSQSMFTLVLLLAVLVLYGFFYQFNKLGKLEIDKCKVIPKIALVLAGIFVLLVIFMMVLTTNDKLPQFLEPLKEIGYFNFDDNWGNGRGFTWKTSLQIFTEYPIINKLFGSGPDCFASYSYEYYNEMLTAKWGEAILTNAHNEWFTSLLFFGVTGFVSYLGIFISQLLTCIKKANKFPILIAFAMCIAAYMGHNFFCYQQIVCTPLIFILMGMGEGILRREENVL